MDILRVGVIKMQVATDFDEVFWSIDSSSVLTSWSLTTILFPSSVLKAAALTLKPDLTLLLFG